MPAGVWSKKDERQYKAILKSCTASGKPSKRCKSMAAATVNKQRATEGRTKSSTSCQCPKGSRRMRTRKGWCYNPSTRKRARLRCKSVRRR